jgi:hypothetical protein
VVGIYSEQQQIASVWNTLYNKNNHQLLKLLLTN